MLQYMLVLDSPREFAQSMEVLRLVHDMKAVNQKHTLTGLAGGTVLWGGIAKMILWSDK